MGGICSGRHHRPRRVTTDEAIGIDIRDICRLPLHLDTWHAAPHIQKHDLPLYVRVRGDDVILGIGTYGDIREIGHAAITGSHRNFGGSQSYFLCPNHDCGRRAAILYLSEDVIGCRSCSCLDYQSQHDDAHIRLLRRAAALRNRLGGKPSILQPISTKPRGMHRCTYDHMVFMINALEQEAIANMKSNHLPQWVRKIELLESMA